MSRGQQHDDLAGPRFDYTRITERWDTPASRQQREMAYLRYTFTARVAAGRRYLDVACGAGRGLALAQEGTGLAVGGDLMEANLVEARTRVLSANLVRLTADRLPFRDGAFDVLSCLEAVYYFPDPVAFFREAWRVLAGPGQLVMSWPNAARPGFNVSPGARQYPSPDEARDWLDQAGFDPTIWGAFSWAEESATGRLLERCRRVAVRLRVIPGTLAGRAKLKRLLYRDVKPVSALDVSLDVDAAMTLIEAPTDGSPYTTFMCVAVGRPKR